MFSGLKTLKILFGYFMDSNRIKPEMAARNLPNPIKDPDRENS